MLKNIVLGLRTIFSFWIVAVLISFIIRGIFLFFYKTEFNECGLADLAGGLIFDISTASMFVVPVIILWLMPFKKLFKVSMCFLFFVYIATMIADWLYFPFQQRHLGYEVILMQARGFELQLIDYITTYWHWIVAGILLLFASCKILRLLRAFDYEIQFIYKTIVLLIATPLVIIGIRGGFQLRPIHMTDAGEFVRPTCAPLAINGVFSFIKSFEGTPAEWQVDITDSEACACLKPFRTPIQSNNKNAKQPNIIVLVIESYSREFSIMGSHLAGRPSMTPFLDSLALHNASFINYFANARRTMDGVVAIVSGIPALMRGTYIYSNYVSPYHVSLPQILEKYGYKTYFFLGSFLGTMGIYQYSTLVGFDRYFSMEDYPDQTHFDGTWGIYDHLYLKWVANVMDTLPQPFFTVVLTLSSHQPYAVPDSVADKLNEDDKVLRSLKYADYAVKTFFHELEKSGLLDSTIIIITCDHPMAPYSKAFANRISVFAGNLILINTPLRGVDSNRVVQQIDLFPTVLDIAGVPDTVFSIGISLFDTITDRFAITYYDPLWQWLTDSVLISFDNKTFICNRVYLDSLIIGQEIKCPTTELCRFKASLHFLKKYLENPIDATRNMESECGTGLGT